MRRALATAALAAAALTLGSAAASHAADRPKPPDLGELAAVDAGNLGDSLDGVAQKATTLAGASGAELVKQAVPAVGKAAGSAVKKTTDPVQRAVGTAAGAAGRGVGGTMTASQGRSAPAPLPAGPLPVAGLPIAGLPTG
ncbi:ATP-binding protein [Streptomyces roseoverticillatus]|uniref:ATP-binding protein n=1 Tax=Streptomyces roseoverticillatus TaxID=66429 RepID=UPI001F3D2E23|nr:ATP-binding protein [Streptomyces roseoverticillatus]MCF3101122.1 ATP-binding protein [Streptomyces roseoverticillatus]